MKIQSVRIEGFHNVECVEYTFDNCNYIIGKNGAGKSTILQAIQFGFLGYIPGTNKRSGDIIKHSNCNSISVAIKFIDGDNIVEVNRSLSKRGKSFDEAFSISEGYNLEDILGNLELPSVNFSEFIGMSANQQKEYLLSILPSFSKEIDTKKYLKSDDNYSPVCEAIVNKLSAEFPKLKSIQDIKNLNDRISESKSVATKEEKRLASTTQSLVFYDDLDSSLSVDELKVELENLNKRKTALVMANEARESNAELECKIAELKSKSLQEDEISRYELSLNVATKNTESTQDLLDGLTSIIKECSLEKSKLNKIIEQGSVCPLLYITCQSLETNLDGIKDSYDTYCSNEIEARNKFASAKELQENSVQEAKRIQDILDEDKHNKELIVFYNSQLRTLPDGYFEPLTKDELDEEINKITGEISKAAANEQYEALVETIQKDKATTKLQLDFLKSVEKSTGENGLQTELMDKPFKDLAQAMLEIYTTLGVYSGSPEFILEAKANSFNFGLRREQFVPFDLLSSGEKCIYTIVFLLALQKIATSKLKLIMIDDLLDHLDDTNFKTVINNITRIEGNYQVIFAGVKEIEGALEVNTIKVGD